MSVYYIGTEGGEYISHHGILGQKWGIRRYQNADGTLTPEGKARYGEREAIINPTMSKKSQRLNEKIKNAKTDETKSKYEKALNKSRAKDQAKELKRQIKFDKNAEKGNKAIKKYGNDAGTAFTKTEHKAMIHQMVDPFIGGLSGATVGFLTAGLASGGSAAGVGALIGAYAGAGVGAFTGGTAQWRASTTKGYIINSSKKRS